jgi:hypothetical protein
VTARLVFCALVIALLVWMFVAVKSLAVPAPPDERTPTPPPNVVTVQGAPVGPPTGAAARLEAAALRRRVRREHARYLTVRHQLVRLRVRTRTRWRPTVDYAIRLASAVTGVPAQELYAVARCESGLNPFARNGRYLGVFQLGWAPFGAFSPFDPVANALSAAVTVRRDGSWRQWECRP